MGGLTKPSGGTIAGITSDGTTVTVDADLVVTTGHLVETEKITALPGGNVSVAEHADDGGSNFLVCTRNGALIINGPAGGIQMQVAGTLKSYLQAAALRVQSGVNVETEKITPLSGGNISITEHADDGGTSFLVGAANGSLVLTAPAGSIQFVIGSGAAKQVIYATYTYVNGFLELNEVTDPGAAPAGRVRIFRDAASDDLEANFETTTDAVLAAGP